MNSLIQGVCLDCRFRLEKPPGRSWERDLGFTNMFHSYSAMPFVRFKKIELVSKSLPKNFRKEHMQKNAWKNKVFVSCSPGFCDRIELCFLELRLLLTFHALIG